MNSRPWRPRLGVLIAMLVGFTSTAAAHGDLKSSIPANKARVAVPPTELRLVFTERPELPLTRIVLRGPDGKNVTLGKLVASGADRATITTAIAGAMAPGLYTVEWEIAGEDGHPVDGRFTFTVLSAEVPAAVPASASDTVQSTRDSAAAHHDTVAMPSSPTRFDAESGGYVGVRFFYYAALLIVIGAVAFRYVVLKLVARQPQPDDLFLAEAQHRAARVGLIASIVLLTAGLARLFAQSFALNGDEMGDPARISALLSATNWGRSWVAQLSATVAALAGFVLARRTGSERQKTGWMVTAIAALILAFAPAFASHAASAPSWRPIAMVADGFHILGASGWLGSLLVVLIAGIPAAMALAQDRRGTAVADLINAFSPTALMFAGLVAATGLFAAWIHLGSLAALWESTYGKLLLAKLAILSIVALTGAYNWLRVKPSLGSDDGVVRIRRSASVEVGVGVLVLLITAILVATPTPMDRM